MVTMIYGLNTNVAYAKPQVLPAAVRVSRDNVDIENV